MADRLRLKAVAFITALPITCLLSAFHVGWNPSSACQYAPMLHAMLQGEAAMVPEDVGRKAARMLLEEIHRGGVTDGTHQVTAHLADNIFMQCLLHKVTQQNNTSMSVIHEGPRQHPRTAS